MERKNRARWVLRLEDGTTLPGWSFGGAEPAAGEVVFTTGMTGYVESLTDPSYRGQILLMTSPLQGNYGVPDAPRESDRIQAQGLIVSSDTGGEGHHPSRNTLSRWLIAEGVPGIEGIDCRTLTRKLRQHGTLRGVLAPEALAPGLAEAQARRTEMSEAARLVAPREIVRYPGGDLQILVIDTGAKEGIFRSIQSRGASVVRAPFHAEWERLLPEVDGILLTNGPGDPMSLLPLVERLRGLLGQPLPLFGICLGHQLLALAAGAKTFKLPFGHRSQNQPVSELASGRAFVTSQNHGYAVDDSTLPPDWEPSFVNLHDGTNEGIRHKYRPYRSVQFHPEGCPGPRDTAFLFDEFLRIAGELRSRESHGRSRSRVLTQAS